MLRRVRRVRGGINIYIYDYEKGRREAKEKKKEVLVKKKTKV